MKVKKEKNEKKSYKNAKLRERGVTLIALIVTIIIMLILAAIGIRAISGDNGAISKAKETKEMQRATEIKEYIRLTANDNKIAKYSKNEIKSKNQVIQELYNQGKLKEEEVEELKNTSVINIKGIEVDFSKLGPTLGSVYTDEMIGQKITYSANGVNDWAILGRDDNGNILIVPRDNLTEQVTIINEGENRVEAWLNYEERLHSLCSVYGTEVQNVKVKARSVTLDDIWRAVGFRPDSLINTYNLKDGSELSQKLTKLNFPGKNEEGTYEMVSFEESKLEELMSVGAIFGFNSSTNKYQFIANTTIEVPHNKSLDTLFTLYPQSFAIAYADGRVKVGDDGAIEIGFAAISFSPWSASPLGFSGVFARSVLCSSSSNSEGNITNIEGEYTRSSKKQIKTNSRTATIFRSTTE